MTWSTACPDWAERIAAGRAPLPDGLPLFPEEAGYALRVFKRLRLPDVIGTPPLAEAGQEWFFSIVAAIFGSYDAARNERLLQEVFLLVPKKNGKTTYSAGVMVTAAIVNRRPLAEFQLIATTKEVADIAFKRAAGMILLDPELLKLFLIQHHTRTITHRLSGATIKVKAADTDTVTGSLASPLIDEVHEFATKPRAADLYTEIRGAFAARPDGFLLQISSQSKSPPAGVFKAELAQARAIRDGRLKLPSVLPVLYELPQAVAKEGGWKRRELWPLINPNYERSVRRAFLEEQLLKAEDKGIEALTLFASQHFNIEIGLSLLADRWAGADFWEAAGDPELTFESILDRCEVCAVGIDGGGLDDLLGFALLGREKGREEGNRRWLLWTHAWAHLSVLDRRKSEAARLRDLEATGDLDIVEDMEKAFAALAGIAAQVDAKGLLCAVGVDPAGVGAIVDALAEKGIEGNERVVGIAQGWTLSGPIKTAEVKLASGALVHCGQPLMAWAVGNARIEPRGNAVVITKQAAGTAKIDPLMAALDAIALMSRNPPAMGEYIYADGREFLAV